MEKTIMITSKEVVAEIDKLTEQGRATREIIDIIYENYNENITYRQMRRLMTGARGNAVRDKPKLDYLNSNGKGERININNRQEAYREQLKINQDGSQEHATVIQMKAGQDKDVDFVLRAHGYDPAEWKIVSVINNFWQQGSSENGTRDLYQSKINVKPIGENDIERVIAKFKLNVKPITYKKNKQYSKRNLVLPFADLHFGITNLADLNSKVAEMVEVIKNGYDTIVVELIGDLLHSDKINTTETVSGTILNDVDMPAAINDAMIFMETIMKKCIENSNKVLVKIVGGNHDFDSNYMFSLWIKEHFKQTNVDINSRYRTAYLLGNVLISIQHGDVNKKNPAQILANENSNLWGLSSTREIHTGHMHFEKTIDQNGVMLRQFGTPKKSDPWEIKNGFVGSIKQMYALEYDENKLKREYYI